MDNHAAMINPIESVVFPLIYLYFLTNGDKIKMIPWASPSKFKPYFLWWYSDFIRIYWKK